MNFSLKVPNELLLSCYIDDDDDCDGYTQCAPTVRISDVYLPKVVSIILAPRLRVTKAVSTSLALTRREVTQTDTLLTIEQEGEFEIDIVRQP